MCTLAVDNPPLMRHIVDPEAAHLTQRLVPAIPAISAIPAIPAISAVPAISAISAVPAMCPR